MLNLILPLNLVTGYIAAKMSAVTTDCSVSLNDGLDVLVAWSNDFEIRPRRGALRHLLPIGVRKDPALNDQQLNRVLDDTERFDRVTQDPAKEGAWRSWHSWRLWFYKIESLVHQTVLSLVLTFVLIWTVMVCASCV